MKKLKVTPQNPWYAGLPMNIESLYRNALLAAEGYRKDAEKLKIRVENGHKVIHQWMDIASEVREELNNYKKAVRFGILAGIVLGMIGLMLWASVQNPFA